MTAKAANFEKLGAFYLGRRFDTAQGVMGPEPILYDSRDLTTHAVAIGMTGSGKTGLFLDTIEEAAIDQVPAICIDPKGDLANLFLTFPKLRPADFQPWVDPRQAERKGLSVDAYAQKVSQQWKNGLASFGQSGARIKRLRDAVDLALYTPKSRVAMPLAVLSSLKAPNAATLADSELFDARVDTAAEGILTLLGSDASELDQSRAFLGALLAHAWQKGESPSIGDLIRMVADPPLSRIGVLDLDTFFPPKARTALALKLNGPLARPGFAQWLEGDPLDVQRLLYTSEGKPRVSVISIAHLSDRERMFFVTLLLNEMIGWMRQQPGTGSLRALLAMDEVFGFLPPVQEPPSKRLFLTLLKQARAYGVGLFLATQNPVDLDYKALSNAGSWFLGRLQTERDVDRVMDGLLASGAGAKLKPEALRRTLAGLPKRVFVMNNIHEPGPVTFHTRWALSYLRGPLTREELGRLGMSNAASDSGKQPQTPPSARKNASEAATLAERPPITTDIEEVFLGEALGQVTYQPHLLAEVDVHHIKAHTNIDVWGTRLLLTPLSSAKDVFARSSPLADVPAISNTGAAEARYAPLPNSALSSAALKRHHSSAKKAVYKTAKLKLGRCKKLKLYAQADETFDAFMARVRHRHREQRDLAVSKARAKFEKRLATAERKVAQKEERLAREKGQAQQSQLDTAIGIGTTVLGALFGGVRGGARGAATATRKAGRAMQQRADVSRAEAALLTAKDDLAELQAAAQQAVVDAGALPEPPVEQFELAPRKSDLGVRSLRLAWVPQPSS